MPRELTISNVRADANLVAINFDFVERKLAHVDQRFWRQYVDFHQVDKRRPSCEKHCVRLMSDGLCGFRCASGLLKCKVLHELASSIDDRNTSFTAATMLG